MQKQSAIFNNKLLPYILLLPQVIVTLIFFILPGINALRLSFYRGDEFGL